MSWRSRSPARPIIEKGELGLFHQDRLAVFHLQLQLAVASDDLLRRDAVTLLANAHELDPPPVTMYVLNSFPADTEQLEHRLVDQVGVGLVELGAWRSRAIP